MFVTEHFAEAFRHPFAEFRSIPFWAWNDELDEDELCRQIRIFKEMGFGGFFMHSRAGLRTEYLGKKWFDCVRACVAQAARCGLRAWAYDEDRWPSGVAGGAAVSRPEFSQKGLTCRVFDPYAPQTPGDFVFPLPGGKTMVVSIGTAPATSGANLVPYLDTMNPDAVAEFIAVTHEKYAEELPPGAIAGFFTDEPEYRAFQHDLPWTERLPEEFDRRRGYELIPRLPELFLDTGEQSGAKVRLDYFRTLTELFTESYAKRIGEWCGTHHTVFTGHVLGEDDLWSQTLCVGSAMRFYQFMQLPGMDVLTDHWLLFMAAKQLSSVKHQFGRSHAISEMYGCTGWDFPLEGHKATGDWHLALGVDLRCPHLAWYSMAGEAKRDYPASISFQQPWHAAYHGLEDYFARIGTALATGNPVRHILVIHPIESLWAGKPLSAYAQEERINRDGYFLTEDSEKIRENRRLTEVGNILLRSHLDFDFGDEEILAGRGSCEGPRLAVGAARYDAVVIPPLRTIRQTTLDLLRSLAESCGTVFYCGEPPELLDGLAAPPDIFHAFHPITPECLPEALAGLREASVADESGRELSAVLTAVSGSEEHRTLFCCNTSVVHDGDMHQAPNVAERGIIYPNAKIRWNIPAKWYLYECDPFSGRLRLQRNHLIATSFDRLESRLYFAAKHPVVGAEHGAAKAATTAKAPAATMLSIEPETPNCLVLDHFEFRGETRYVLDIDDLIRDGLELPRRSAGAVQPWYAVQHRLWPEHSCEVVLRTVVGCDEVPEDATLALEEPTRWRISLNGMEVPPEDAGYYFDPAIRRIPVPAALWRLGDNQLELCGRYDADHRGLEAVYLTGRFAVTDLDRIASRSPVTDLGDLRQAGFPYYAGNAVYRFQVDAPPGARMRLKLRRWRGAAIGVLLPEEPERLLFAPPYEADFPLPADGVITLRLYGHLRNAFGPFYAETSPTICTPGKFRCQLSDSRQTVPFGIFKINFEFLKAKSRQGPVSLPSAKHRVSAVENHRLQEGDRR